ncbi:MAG: circularly permuted type 2 ATP-grasp protein, partial [Planctomycetaceae bacterium]|nr:circularly permuted type 2 ATP-grasp protein [Planctomycetaceae bacterium]
MKFQDYDAQGFYDEWLAAPGQPRPEASLLVRMLESLPAGELQRRQQAAERAFLLMGITFAVYGHRDGAEKVWPFDLLPRLIVMDEWERIDRGLRQRIQALNLFLNDIYHAQRIVRDRVVPEEVIRTARSFRPECIGLHPPAGIWAHIVGTDLVRDRDGRYVDTFGRGRYQGVTRDHWIEVELG